MAIVSVDLTSESLHHLMQILDAAIDTMKSPIDITDPFKPLVTALYHMVAVAATRSVPGPVPIPTTGTSPTTGGLQLELPALTPTEQALVAQLERMQKDCADSIRNTNTAVGYKLVLEV